MQKLYKEQQLLYSLDTPDIFNYNDHFMCNQKNKVI